MTEPEWSIEDYPLMGTPLGKKHARLLDYLRTDTVSDISADARQLVGALAVELDDRGELIRRFHAIVDWDVRSCESHQAKGSPCPDPDTHEVMVELRDEAATIAAEALAKFKAGLLSTDYPNPMEEVLPLSELRKHELHGIIERTKTPQEQKDFEEALKALDDLPKNGEGPPCPACGYDPSKFEYFDEMRHGLGYHVDHAHKRMVEH